jgi:hypothetical protein
VKLIQEIGSYAGFAAVLGLAILSALSFSQARDVRRLRDWAGRAPERDAEARSRVAAAGNLRQTPAAQAQAGQAAAAASGGNSGGAGAPAPAPSKAPLVAASAAGAASAATGAGAAGAARGGVSPMRPGQRVSAQTSILPAQDEPRERWYRRMAPRYIALIVAGVLVVGGGIAVGATQFFKSGSGGATGSAGGKSSPKDPKAGKPKSAAIRPADVSVAVLNATPVAGLASQFGDRAQALGFTKDNVGNYRGAQRAESVVMYAPGREREAKFVRKKFNINSIEAVDPTVQADAPQADVIVVVGADKSGG